MAKACREILELTMQTRDVAALRPFYAETLGLRLIRDEPSEITIAAGGTQLTFVETADGHPIYHFAFNIPENKLDAAMGWLRPRAPLHREPGGGEVYDFASWNAHAVYFFDPAGNILEFIARHNLKNAAPLSEPTTSKIRSGGQAVGLSAPTVGPFSPTDILYASEIGIVVDDVASAVAAAKRDWSLHVFNGTQSHDFAAVGTDEALLIFAQRGREWSGSDGVAADVFPTRAVFSGDRAAKLDLPGYPFDLAMTGIETP